jgi:class 3 adenylate cyclase
MDAVVWLRSLGLGKYEAAFRENEIDETVLPTLTADDLKDLGVAALGDRRKLLDAIAALRTDERKASSADIATTSRAPRVSPEDRAERRHVTVMFSDLIGFTALSGRIDPEDLREVISAYQKCVAETIGRFGGFVAKFWATASSSTLAIRRPMRMTQSGLCAQGWSWSLQSVI